MPSQRHSQPRKATSPFQVPKFEVRWIVERLHVGTSPFNVVRAVSYRLRRSTFTKANRKAVYCYALQVHRQNQQLYRAVTGSI
jgi:hypothetical protein